MHVMSCHVDPCCHAVCIVYMSVCTIGVCVCVLVLVLAFAVCHLRVPSQRLVWQPVTARQGNDPKEEEHRERRDQ